MISRGCWYTSAKDTTDDYPAIDVRRWQRDGLLERHQSFIFEWLRNDKVIGSINVSTEPGRVTLTFRHQRGGGEWKDKKHSVYLDWTECHYGGMRPWFLCPASGCGRRVAILYGAGVFTCRYCLKLAYPSQREAIDDRAARRANKIRKRLDWQQGVLNPKGWKKTQRDALANV